MIEVFVLEVDEYNSYSYDGTISTLKGVFSSEEKAHEAGKAFVKSGYPSYSVDQWEVDKVI